MNRGVNASIWLWATESGEQHAGSEHELVTCLSSRALPAYTLVWRSGWSEWLPAMQVKELARGLPESSLCAPRAPRATAPGVPPPPPPIETYPMLRRWAEELRQSSGPITRREGVPIWAQTVVLNEPPPTSAELDEITDEIPDEVLAEAARLMMEATPPRDLGIAERARRSRTSWPAVILPQDPFAPPLEPPELASFIDPSSTAFDTGAQTPSGEDRRHVGLPGETVERPRSRGWLWLLPAAALAGGLWLTRAHWLPVAGPRSAPEPQVAVLPVRPAATAEPPPAPKVFGCRVLKRPQKLDDWSIPDKPLGMGLAPDGKRIALGYAQSRERAIGLTFDPSRFVARGEAFTPKLPAPSKGGTSKAPASRSSSDSAGADAQRAPTNAAAGEAARAEAPDANEAARAELAAASPDPASVGSSREFVHYREEEIYSVTPLVASGKLEFRVERVGDKLANGTAIDGVPALRIGQNEVGIVGGPLGRRPHRIWWLPRPGLTAVPTYTRHPLGHLIATRVGRKDPTLRVGVISLEAAPHTALEALELPKGALGVPALASKATVMALAVVVDAERGAADRLMLARATPTALPASAEALGVFGSEPVQLSSPALSALGAQGFALSWTQGVAEERRVKLLVLDDELRPRGEPFDMELPEVSHRGVINGGLFWANERLLALYYLRRPEGYSLWANEITCDEH
jgi:hypothetical protein